MKKRKNASQMLDEVKEMIEKENMAAFLVMFEEVQLFLDKRKLPSTSASRKASSTR